MSPRIAALECIGHSISPYGGFEAAATLQYGLKQRQPPWEEIAFLANTHLVTPLLWMGWHRKCLVNALPEDFYAYLAQLYQQNAMRNGHLLSQLLEITQALNRQGIVPVALKGAAYLLTGIFPAPGARITADLDLLVPRKQLAASINALKAIGYGTEKELVEEFNNHHHYAPLFRPGEFASIELHHNLMAASAENILPMDTVWQHVEPMAINGISLQILSPTYQVLHSFLHSQIVDRHYERGIIALRALSDLAYLQHRYQQHINWRAIEALLSQHGKQQILHFYLYLAHRYFGMPLPITIAPSLASFLHHQRCRSKIRWPWLMEIDRRIQHFSAHHIYRLYGYPNTCLALTVGRLRYATKVTRKYFDLLLKKNN